jgi:predicted nucleic-acid-binding protein
MSLALDTNVLVRLLTRDDEAQCAAAVRLVLAAAEVETPALLSLGVLLETEWVLRSRYKLSPADIHHAFTAVLETHELAVQEPSVLEEALKLWRDWPGSDFADCMHVATAVQCDRTLATFDHDAARLPGAALIPP